jgi:hypothetical protein
MVSLVVMSDCYFHFSFLVFSLFCSEAVSVRSGGRDLSSCANINLLPHLSIQRTVSFRIYILQKKLI